MIVFSRKVTDEWLESCNSTADGIATTGLRRAKKLNSGEAFDDKHFSPFTCPSYNLFQTVLSWIPPLLWRNSYLKRSPNYQKVCWIPIWVLLKLSFVLFIMPEVLFCIFISLIIKYDIDELNSLLFMRVQFYFFIIMWIST